MPRRQYEELFENDLNANTSTHATRISKCLNYLTFHLQFKTSHSMHFINLMHQNNLYAAVLSYDIGNRVNETRNTRHEYFD